MRCSTVTPGATACVQPRGTCRFATARMLRAAWRSARTVAASAPLAMRTISAREISTGPASASNRRR
jgi:hypothetical protein